MGAFNLETCARQNILKLVPYRCARDDYKDDGTNVLLDANENCYGPSLAPETLIGGASYLSGLNRYPDPHQIDLKQRFCSLRNEPAAERPIKPENLFLGVGSDEAIDALLRCFCRPGKDKILTCPPTYGMYSVSAQVNDVEVVKVDLDLPSTSEGVGKFGLRVPAISAVLSETAEQEKVNPDAGRIKVVYLCSPGNPTGTLVNRADVIALLNHPTYNGIIVVDEAYIDFSPAGSSMAPLVTSYPNLVVMQTLSKAFGLAGIRLGAAFTSPAIATLLNNLKAPYSISTPTSFLADQALSQDGLAAAQSNLSQILAQRERLLAEVPKIPGVGRLLGGTDSNFLLYEILDRPVQEGGKPCNVTAQRLYESLAEQRGVVVRFRGKEAGCLGCLRITVGTEAENTRLIDQAGSVLREIYGGK